MTHFDPSWCSLLHGSRRAAPARVLPTGSPYRPIQVPTVHDCECCGVRMYDHHCKIVCPNCGYKRDCSDP